MSTFCKPKDIEDEFYLPNLTYDQKIKLNNMYTAAKYGAIYITEYFVA